MTRNEAAEIGSFAYSNNVPLKETYRTLKLLSKLDDKKFVSRLELYKLGLSKKELDGILEPLLSSCTLVEYGVESETEFRKDGKPCVNKFYKWWV